MARIAQDKQSFYIPSRIRKARVMKAYSMAELANMLSVTPQAISQYELGTICPSDSIMRKMSQALDFPLAYFTTPVPNVNFAESASFFRRKQTVSAKHRSAFEERSNLVIDVINYLSEYIDFPEVNMPDLSALNIGDDIDVNEMDEVTSIVRKWWSIPDGPIDSMTDILQQNGVILSRLEHPNAKVDAFSMWKEGRPYIYLNTIKSSLRDRFDMAHELGHLILHTKYNREDLLKKEIYERVESQANMFAGSLLLHSDKFFSEAITSSIDRLLVLKKKWKVSVSAMIYKLENYRILSQYQIEYLKRQMTERGMWRKEPYDDIADYDTPDVLKQAIDVIIEHGYAKISDIVNNIPLYPRMIESICCLSTGYLAPKQENSVRPKPFLQLVK